MTWIRVIVSLTLFFSFSYFLYFYIQRVHSLNDRCLIFIPAQVQDNTKGIKRNKFNSSV